MTGTTTGPGTGATRTGPRTGPGTASPTGPGTGAGGELPPGGRATTVVHAAVRGTIGAMAMSGLRQVTRSLDLVRQTPPESVLQRTAPSLFQRVPVPRRPALVELAHWAYGAAGGAVFGLVPRNWRRRAWAGPVYGLLVWAAFEGGIAPALGLAQRPRHGGVQATMLLLDHLLYGVVVAASPWPIRD